MKSIDALMNLSERVALVTGAAGHIGSACCRALAQCGASVAAVDLAEYPLLELCKELSAEYGVKAVALAANLAAQDEVETLPVKAAEVLGRLDILINCAAFVGTSDLKGWAVPFEKQSAETWRAAFEVNLTSCFVLVQAALPYLKAGGKGAVVNVGSIYGLVGPDWSLYDGTELGNPAAYAASKGGLNQFTRWLATTLAPDVRVNAISPGGVFRNQPEEFVERYVRRTPLGRMATEEDMVGAVLYLASDLSSYVTGQNIAVDGGWTAW